VKDFLSVPKTTGTYSIGMSAKKIFSIGVRIISLYTRYRCASLFGQHVPEDSPMYDTLVIFCDDVMWKRIQASPYGKQAASQVCNDDDDADDDGTGL
jgi:hypothetical protein